MSIDTDQHSSLNVDATLRAILALLIAEQRERNGRGPYMLERILSQAGLSDDQIATIAGSDADQVRAAIDARPRSVIDRARQTLTQ